MLKTTVPTEHHASQTIKALLQCNNITTDDLAAYETMPPEMRMWGR